MNLIYRMCLREHAIGKVDVCHGFRGGTADTPEPLGKHVATVSYQYAKVVVTMYLHAYQ